MHTRRRVVVQSILRTFNRKGLSCKFPCLNDIVVLYPDGSQCGLLECLGYYTQGMERLSTTHYSGAYRRDCSPGNIMLSSTNHITDLVTS